jgi:hypothetical protein
VRSRQHRFLTGRGLLKFSDVLVTLGDLAGLVVLFGDYG